MNKHPFTLYREAHGITQQELAELLGLSQPHISSCEAGRRQVSWRNLEMIENKTNGEISKESLRPDIFGRAA